MKKPLRILCAASGILLALSAAAGVAEVLGLSVCLFYKPLHAWILLPFLTGLLGLTVCLCRYLRTKRANAAQTLPYTLTRCILIGICVLTVLLSVPAAMLTSVSYMDSRLCADKTYQALFENSVDGDPIAHLYAQYSPFLAKYRASAVLYDFSGEAEEIEVEWEDDGCTVYYPGYAEDAAQTDERQMLSRRLYK